MNKRKAFTLLEFLVTVVILGILVSIAVPGYQRAINQAKVKDVKSNLRAVYAAQKIRYMKGSGYYGSTNEFLINQNLHLDLEYIAGQSTWNYSTGTNPNQGNGLGFATGTLSGIEYSFKIHDDPADLVHGPGEPYCYSPAGCDSIY